MPAIRYPRRAKKAAETRARIVAAAAEAFAERGYLATTIADVATRADVAAPTVYATFGSKRALLAEAIDVTIAGDDEPIPVNDRPWMSPVWAAATGPDVLRAYASAVGTIQGRTAALFEALDTAAAGEPELRDLHDTTNARRRLGATGVIDAVRRHGGLRRGLSRREAIDILWTLNGHAPYLALVRDCGWRPARYERWLGATMIGTLCAPTPTSCTGIGTPVSQYQYKNVGGQGASPVGGR